MKSHFGHGRNGGSGALIRSQKHALSWGFASSQGDEEASFDTLGSFGDDITLICGAWSFRRYITDENRLFNKGFLE